MSEWFDGLPGHALVRRALEDLSVGRTSEASLVLQAYAERARGVGLPVPSHEDAELALARLLHGEPGGHATYLALMDEVWSFLAAAEARRRRAL